MSAIKGEHIPIYGVVVRWIQRLINRCSTARWSCEPKLNWPQAFALVPYSSIEAGLGTFLFNADRPWLHLRFQDGLPTGKWISIRYSTSLYDKLARPAIRFKTSMGDQFEYLPSALFGSGIWTGYVPSDTTAVLVSPAETAGNIGFRVDVCAVIPFWHIIGLVFIRSPQQASDAMLALCAGSTTRARRILHSALRAYPFQSYDSWRRHRLRQFEPSCLEKPRIGWDNGPHIRFVIDLNNVSTDVGIIATLSSLCEQTYPNWSLLVLSSSEQQLAMINNLLAKTCRHAVLVDQNSSAVSVCSGLGRDAFLAPLVAGCVLPNYALALVAEFSASHPDYEIIYADEDEMDERGVFHDPKLKPDWSPTFHFFSNYVGQAVYVRCGVISCEADAQSRKVIASENLLGRIFLSDTVRVGHLRRVLLTSTAARICTARAHVDRPAPSPHNRSAQKPFATVIIPSKDKAQLLEACLKGLVAAQPRNFEIIIVDNGSEEPLTFSLYERWKQDSRIRIQYSPGQFNFSALCNSGAAIAKAPTLVFLNNDTVACTADWIATLSAWAQSPGIGAVGTKLIYPSGRLQHAGVVLGLGGYAAHIDHTASPHHSGYLQGSNVPREMSAVTAACLAVEKAKFDHVGGFEEKGFPVELSDMDLCLRLSSAGWRTICLPEPVLVHHESATRGRAPDMDVAYGDERRLFWSRWHSYILDDPYFHPALSLYSSRTALD